MHTITRTLDLCIAPWNMGSALCGSPTWSNCSHYWFSLLLLFLGGKLFLSSCCSPLVPQCKVGGSEFNAAVQCVWAGWVVKVMSRPSLLRRLL